MQIAQSASFLSSISQALKPIQGTSPVKTQSPDKKAKDASLSLASANDAQPAQASPPSASTRRGGTVNLLV